MMLMQWFCSFYVPCGALLWCASVEPEDWWQYIGAPMLLSPLGHSLHTVE
jgi:hypothetical protein